MNKQILEELIHKGLSIKEISEYAGKSKSTIRHYLSKYELKTLNNKCNSKEGNLCICNYCNKKYLYKRRTGSTSSMCASCRVFIRSKIIKKELVDILGGKCSKCGYDKTIEALQFHHIDPSNKEFMISGNYNRSKSSLLKEVSKCILLCSNCHIEEHIKLQSASSVG